MSCSWAWMTRSTLLSLPTNRQQQQQQQQRQQQRQQHEHNMGCQSRTATSSVGATQPKRRGCQRHSHQCVLSLLPENRREDLALLVVSCEVRVWEGSREGGALPTTRVGGVWGGGGSALGTQGPVGVALTIGAIEWAVPSGHNPRLCRSVGVGSSKVCLDPRLLSTAAPPGKMGRGRQGKHFLSTDGPPKQTKAFGGSTQASCLSMSAVSIHVSVFMLSKCRVPTDQE